jgi:hypothetical protein
MTVGMVGFWEVLGGAVGAVYVLSAAMLALMMRLGFSGGSPFSMPST